MIFRSKNTILILIAIVIIGSIFRFYGLGAQSLWTDELASWDITRRENLKSVIEETIKDDQPPGYYIFLYYVQKYLGDSEVALRIPSVFAGLLCIIAIFILGSRLYSDKEGLFAAAVMSFTWCPIYFSQEARSYIFLVLFSILSVYFWLFIIERLELDRKPLRGDIVFYVIFASLCCYTHYFGAYLIALQGLAAALYVLTKKKAAKYIFLIYLIVAVVFSPWLQAFYAQLGNVAPKATSYEPISVLRLVKFVGYIFGAQKSPFLSLETYTNFDIIISIIIILLTLGLIALLFLLKIYGHLKNRDLQKQYAHFIDSDVILLLWLTIPFFGIYLLGRMSFTVFNYRYLLISLPAAYLLLSRSITNLFSNTKVQAAVMTLFAVIFSIHLVYYKKYYSYPIKEQYREAVNYVIENDKFYEDSKIIGYAFDHFFDYYLQRAGSTKKIDLYVNWRKDMMAVLDKINSMQTQYIWLISAHLSPDEKFIKHVSKRYKIIRNATLVEANVWLFEKI